MWAHMVDVRLAVSACHTKSLVCASESAKHLSAFLYSESILAEVYKLLMVGRYCRSVNHEA